MTNDKRLLLTRDLFLRDCHTARSLASAGVGVRALTSNRKSAAVAQATIAADVHHPFDVHLNLLAQVTFDTALLVDDGANAIHFFFAKLADAFVDADSRVTENLVRARSPDPVNICKTDFSPLIGWQVHTCNACHSTLHLAQALSLFCYPCRCLCFGLVQITRTTP